MNSKLYKMYGTYIKQLVTLNVTYYSYGLLEYDAVYFVKYVPRLLNAVT